MKKQIVQVSGFQCAKVAATLYLVISVPFHLLMLIPVMMSRLPIPGFSVTMLILMPVLYTVFGFIFTLIGARVYNLVAKRIGGFEFTTAEVNAYKKWGLVPRT